MNGVRGNASGAAVAVALLFVAFCLAVAAVRGTYYDVWRALDAQATQGTGTTNGGK